MTDPRTPCLIGVGRRTWHPGSPAPEPLEMWAEVARAAADDAGAPGALARLDAIDVVYCETWQYDDPPRRLADALGAAPRRLRASGIGGTTPQLLVDDAAEAILRGELDLALVCSAEALATKRAVRRSGERYAGSFPPAERRPYPWTDPVLPAEVAHEVFQAWLTFAVLDNARRARLGTGLEEYRSDIGAMMQPLTRIAAASPHAWYRTERSAAELVTPAPENRMVGYPYTKYLVAVMDVDMAAALLVASEETADALGVPADQRVYLRGWAHAADPSSIATRPALDRSPAMRAAAAAALATAGAGVDDVAAFDLYSCFAGSLHFACDALGLGPQDPRGLSVTGGLPYHGGPGSGYLTHAIAAMAERLRAEPGALGLVSGVGMHMARHAFAAYSTTPGPVTPPDADALRRAVAPGPVPLLDEHEGEATVAAYSVVHARDGAPEWGLLVCETGAARVYARAEDPGLLARAEAEELVGAAVRLQPEVATGPTGEIRRNLARPGTAPGSLRR